MNNLANNEIAKGETIETARDASAPEQRPDEQPRGGKAPDGLNLASAFLDELARDTGADAFSDIFANDGARHFGATLAIVSACRSSLDSIEATARRVAAEDAQWHRQTLNAWQAAGVTPEGATE